MDENELTAWISERTNLPQQAMEWWRSCELSGEFLDVDQPGLVVFNCYDTFIKKALFENAKEHYSFSGASDKELKELKEFVEAMA